MHRRYMLSVAVVLFSGATVSTLTSPANAQECSVNTAGPVSLRSSQALTICATNLDAPRTARLGVAFYDAFNAREPLRLEYFNLSQGAGTCTTFRAGKDSLTVVARAGYVLAEGDGAEPLALSVQVEPARGIRIHYPNMISSRRLANGVPEGPPV